MRKDGSWRAWVRGGGEETTFTDSHSKMKKHRANGFVHAITCRVTNELVWAWVMKQSFFVSEYIAYNYKV